MTQATASHGDKTAEAAADPARARKPAPDGAAFLPPEPEWEGSPVALGLKRDIQRVPFPPPFVLSLQRRAGNLATTRFVASGRLARITDDDLAARADRGGSQSQRELIDAAILSRDSDDVTEISNFGEASVAERHTLIEILLQQGWVGPSDEYALEAIWNTFGRGLATQVDAHQAMWELSIESGMDPSGIAAVQDLRTQFEEDVKAKARAYMQTNLLYCETEQEKFGLRAAEGPVSPTAETERVMHMEQTQELAASAKKLLEAKDKLLQMHVGYNMVMSPMAGGMTTPVNFDPEKRPTFREASWLQRDTHPPAAHTWEEVKQQWDDANAALAFVTAQSPTVFAALAQGSETVGNLATQSPADARQTIQTVLTALHGNIEATIPKVDTGDLDWRDLRPIHQQLYGGARGGSGVDWSKPLAKSVGQDVIGDHETTEFWINLGLGTAAAALFIVANMATGGLATAALIGGLAIGSGQAISSWENYEDLATAAGSTASEETRLVSEGQVDAARFQAILDTIFAFVDIAGPVLRGARAAQSAARLEALVASRGAQAALGQVGSLAGDAAGRAVLRGIEELGVEATMRQSSKSLDELAAAVRAIPGTPENAAQLRAALARIEEARRIGIGAAGDAGQGVVGAEARSAIAATGTAAEQTWKGTRSAAELVADVPNAIQAGTISRAFGDKVVSEAVDRLGPAAVLNHAGGWQRLAKALPETGATGQKLMAWRNSIFSDLEEYVVRELKGQVQRTGTAGKLSNDIDMSFTGANAAQIKNQASEYLARRLGVSNSPKEFQRIMMADLFTDPRRMHAYDMLPAAVRERVAANQAAKQEQLIWNRRLYEAVHEGDEALATEIRSQMQGMGISEFRYRPLSGADVSTLSSRVDSLWGELEAAQTAGNMGRVERLSGQIGEAQAMINTAEGGGYFSAGGVRRFVTERPGEPGFGRLPGGAGQAIPSAERLTAILDQLPKLDHAALQLTGSTDDVVSAVRGIGKYGGRLQEVIAEAGLRADGGPWESLARQCEQLKRAADSGTTLARMATGEAEAVIREARAAFSQLLSQSDIALQYVRQATQIPNIANAAARMAYMTVAHVRLMRAVNFILGHLEIMARAVRTGSALADMPAAQGTPAEPSAPPAE